MISPFTPGLFRNGLNRGGIALVHFSIKSLSKWLVSGTKRLEAILKMLDKGLPEVYDERIYGEKCNLAYRHAYYAYQGPGEKICSSAA